MRSTAPRLPTAQPADFISPRLAELLGLRKPARDVFDFIALVHRLSYGALLTLTDEIDLPIERTLEALGLAPSTLRRFRARPKEPLPELARERLARLARVTARAEEVLEDRGKAHRWLQEPIRALGMRRPIELLATEAGTELVLQTLGQLEHGLYA
jgi:putative toxin-antitoxin system antitoxin component (TIGR02293 family)